MHATVICGRASGVQRIIARRTINRLWSAQIMSAVKVARLLRGRYAAGSAASDPPAAGGRSSVAARLRPALGLLVAPPWRSGTESAVGKDGRARAARYIATASACQREQTHASRRRPYPPMRSLVSGS